MGAYLPVGHGSTAPQILDLYSQEARYGVNHLDSGVACCSPFEAFSHWLERRSQNDVFSKGSA